MGWNTVTFSPEDPLVEGLVSGKDQFYFVHSYYVEPEDSSLVLFETDYGQPFVSGYNPAIAMPRSFIRKKVQAKAIAESRQFPEDFMILAGC